MLYLKFKNFLDSLKVKMKSKEEKKSVNLKTDQKNNLKNRENDFKK